MSVNGPSERSVVAEFDLDIEVLPAAQDGKPRINEILQSIKRKNCRYAGIINADCQLLPYPNLSQTLQTYLHEALVYSERIDLDSEARAQLDTCSGFDAFFFDTGILPINFDPNFRIGEPWWDYWFPITTALHGTRIANVETPLLTHRIHKQAWDRESVSRGGQLFWSLLKDSLRIGEYNFPSLGESVDALWTNEALTKDQLEIVSYAWFQWLRNRRLPEPLKFLPPGLEATETCMRSLRTGLGKASEENTSLRGENTTLIGLSTYLTQENTKLTEDNVRLTEDNLRLRKEKRELKGMLRKEKRELKGMIEAMEQSTSWRVTKPLRAIVSKARRWRARVVEHMQGVAPRRR